MTASSLAARLIALLFVGASLVSTPLRAGSLLREVFTGIGGSSLADLTNNPAYPNSPTSREILTNLFEAPTDVLENYGQRLRGTFYAPATGNYTFWIASDDASALFLSTDATPANARRIAQVSAWVSSRTWEQYPEQKSALIPLVAGNRYYIEALMKEGGGGDNLAVRWLRPDGVDEGPIPLTSFIAWGQEPEQPKISQSPANTSAPEGGQATFTVAYTNVGPTDVYWQRNGSFIPGARTPTLVVNPVLIGDNGARYRAFLSNAVGTATSSEAILNVIPDTQPPRVVRAYSIQATTVVVEFDEPVQPPAGPIGAAFTFNNGATATAASQPDGNTRIHLAVSGLNFGTPYTLSISGVRDRAGAANPIAPGTSIQFTASELSPTSLAGPTGGATIVNRVATGEFDISSVGGDIGGNADSAGFAWQPLTGNFDLRVRVARFAVTDPFATAGLVARTDLTAGSAFAGVFASAPKAGVFFEARTTANAGAGVQSVRGGYPVNYPYTWLRLRRSGNVLTGFGSMDGTRWTQVGTASLTLPSQLRVGLTVAARAPGATALARFRDYGTAPAPQIVNHVPTREGLDVSSRRTKIVFSELHYNPAPSGPGALPPFIEVFNAGDIPEDLSGWRITGGVDFTFPPGFRLQAGQFAVVSANPITLQSATGLTGVLGPFTGSLAGTGETLQLRDEMDALKLEFTYSDDPPWPAAADGSGHTLVLVNPSYGEDDPRAWAPSALIGGSPGDMDPILPDPAESVSFNEILAHTDLPALDFLELHNRSNADVNLSGYVLTDDVSTNKFRFAAGAAIAARGFLALDENQLGFRLNAAGETLYLVSPDGRRVLDTLKFGGQENGVAFGRAADGAPEFRRLAAPTPGAANASRRLEDVVINEVYYNPITNDDADEFIELHNRSASPVNLAGWRFVDGVDFTFPAGASIPAGGFVVVGASRNRLLANHPTLLPAQAFGDWIGQLSNRGERIALAKPDEIRSTNELGQVTVDNIRIVVGEVPYRDGGRWGKWADGGGSSIELVDPRADTQRAANWADSDERQKAQWQQFTITSPLRFGTQTPDRLHIGMLGEGECLVDDVEVLGPTGTALLSNGGFETGSGTVATGWTLLGHHAGSRVEASGAFSGTRVLRVIAPGDLDAGRNCIRAVLAAGLNNNITGTLRVRARWQAGWPELLLRTRGGGLELTAAMSVPKNLGTPGAPNSRRIPNAGPAIFAVNHSPAVPDANQAVVVTARVSDPDGIGSVNLRRRNGDTGSFTTIAMRDDGLSGDAIAGDGLWSATLAGQTAGTLVQFRVEAFDAAASVASSVFPSGQVFAGAPAVSEANIRWGDPVPFGTFMHVHSWTTPTVDNALGADGLNNLYRDSTLVHGNLRVIYNAGIRRKGSPFTGQADFAVTVPADDLLLGTADRVYGLTGNGGEEATRMRNQIANWFSRSLRLPYLHTHYIQFYRNGAPRGAVSEDLEQPSNYYAESWYPDGGDGDLRKVAFWFEFRDDGGFDVTGADLGNYRNPNGQYNLSRYRWNWQGRPTGTSANDFTNFFNLVTAANARGAAYEANLLNLADIDQWMRMFVLDACLGNWDTWGTGNSQNKYIYFQPGGRWRILPWDMDWVLGVGDGPSRRLFGGQDGNVNFMFDFPAFRRMAWRAYREALDGPFLPEKYRAEFAARTAALAFNQVGGSADPLQIGQYLDARREFIRGELLRADTAAFAITSNNGADFTSATPTATIDGTAPFSAVRIEVNGLPVPIEWLDVQRYRIRVPLTQAVNALTLRGVDRLGNPIPGLSDTVTVRYNGIFERPQDFLVFTEIQYDSDDAGASFLELHNRSTTTSFNLTGWQLSGVGYTFPEGAVIPPGAYWVLVRDRITFATAYGATIPVFDEFPGSLDNNGERIALIQPSTSGNVLITDVRYDNRLPWPTNAAGFGPSLQLLDTARGSWRVANWTATETNAALRVTPGRSSSILQALAEFPTLWINEVLPNNVSGPLDNAGDRDPYIEIVNTGTAAVNLTGLMLTDSFTNLTRWTFPAGTSIPAGGFLTVWADGEPAESAPGAPHTSFRLSPSSGGVALTRLQGFGNTPGVLDYVTWEQIPAGRSLGSIPDGEPRTRRLLFHPTPGAANDPAVPAVNVVINEFMAQNTRTLQDPADGDWDDWIELHNAGTTPVDLAGYYLTDNLTNSLASMFRIPGGYPIPAGGHLLVWADNETGQNLPANSGLHVNFALSRNGEQLGLFDPAGNLVDGFTFTIQTNDISMGRFPDAAAPPLYFMETPTPGTPNVLSGANRPPVFNPVANITVAEQALVTFTASAIDPDAGQTVTYSLGSDAPAGATLDPATGAFRWQTSEADGPRTYAFTLRASDNGSPQRIGTFRASVTVEEINLPPVVVAVANVPASEGQLLRLTLPASDPDLPTNSLAFSPVGTFPDGAALTPEGELTWIPDESRGGTTVVLRYQVVDNGSPALSATGEVRVAVAEINNPPAFVQPDPVTADEGTLVQGQFVASDPEGAALVFRVDGTAPDGFQLDPATGAFTWTPTEDQGPGSYVILVRAAESSGDRLSVVRELLVNVREANRAPTIAPIAARTAAEGSTVAFRATAGDADRPAQTLTFSLDPGAPAGASIDASTGEFTWQTGEDIGATTNDIVVRVTDNAAAPLSATTVARVVTEPRFKVVVSEILRRPVAPGTEFIELFNRSTRTAWNLDGFRLVGSNLTFTFPANTRLAPGAFTSVAANTAAFRAAFGDAPGLAGTWTGTLGAQQDSIALVQPGAGGTPDLVLDQVDYTGSHPWPTAATPSAASLQLVDPRRDRNRAGNWAVAGAFSGNRNVIGFTDSWRYFQSGAPAGGTNWRTAPYNDATWPAGDGLLYVEPSALPAAKSTQLALGQTTYYFRKTVTLPALLPGMTVQVRTILDDGYVLWVNGQRAHFLGIDDAVPTHETFANRVVDNAVIEGPFTIPSNLLVPGENAFAVEVHQVNAGSSDIVFGLEVTLVGGNAVAATPGAANTTLAELPEFPTVRLNEVLARNTTGLADASGTREPWIELVNTGDAPVSLNGLFLSQSDAEPFQFAFPQGWSIPARGFLVVFADGQATQNSASEIHTSFRLPQAAGTPIRLSLHRQLGIAANAVDYLHTTVPASPDVATGHLPDGVVASLSDLVPTPGAANAAANVAPSFAPPVLEPDGRIRLVLTGTPGRRYRVERSTGLGPWETVTEWTADPAGLTLHETPGANPARFFRAVAL